MENNYETNPIQNGDGKISVKEFAQKIKQKYPQYNNVEDTTLTQKMIEKYPEYKNQVFFDTQKPVQPKGVQAGQNGASQSVSANGGSSLESLPKPKKTFAQQAQEAAFNRPKVGEEQKTTFKSNVIFDNKVKEGQKKVENFNQKLTKKVDENYYKNTDINSRWNDVPPPTAQEINLVNSYFPEIDKNGINSADFVKYLKNNTRFYQDNNLDNNPKESQFSKNKYLQDYINERASFLDKKLKYVNPKNTNEYNKIVGELNTLDDKYENYVKTYLPEYYKTREELKLKQKENYERIKKGDISQYYYDAKNIRDNFVKGATNPILDIFYSGLDAVGLDNAADSLRISRDINSYESNLNEITNAQGSVVNYNGNKYIVTKTGDIIDADTKTSITSFENKNTLKKIYDLSKQSKKIETVYSGRGYANAFANTGGNLAMQIFLTKGAGSGLKAIGLGESLAIRAGEVSSVFGMVGASTYEETLRELRDANISDDVAKPQAAKVAALTATASAVSSYFMPNMNANKIMGGLNSKLLIKESIDVLKKEGKEGLANFLKTRASKLIYNAPEIIKEGGGEFLQELIEGKVQYLANQNANTAVGKKVLQEDFKDGEILDTFILSASIGALAAGAGKANEGAFGMRIDHNFDYLSKIDNNEFDKIGNNLIQKGNVTEEQFKNLKDQVTNYRNYKSKLPESIKGKKAVELTQLIAEREQLENEKKTKDKYFHPEYDAKIEQVNNKINEIATLKDEETETTTQTDPQATNPETETINGETTSETKNIELLNNEQNQTGITTENQGGNQEGENTGISGTLQNNDVKGQKGPVVSIAPYFAKTAETVEDARKLRNSEEYKTYVQNLSKIGNLLGISNVNINENIGGYKNKAGTEVIEISNAVELEGATIDQAEEYAAIVAALSPEVQEASIAAQYVEKGSDNHDGNEYRIKVANVNEAVKALKAAGITDFSIDEKNGIVKLINIFKYDDPKIRIKIGKFAEELENNKIEYERQQYKPIESRYVSPTERKQILRRIIGDGSRSQFSGTELRSLIEQSIRRDAEFQGTSYEEYTGIKQQPVAGNRLFNEPLKEVTTIANGYYERVFGQKRPEFSGIRTIDEARAKRISDAFESMKHDPNNPEVKAAYQALAKETIDQYQAFLDAGYSVEINNEEPYSNSQDMINDLRDNKRIKIFSTEDGFGNEPITEQQRQENPLLAKSNFTDVNGKPMLINDLFRAIHDFFGHAELGNSFGPKGEENAWNVHVRMFSPLAARAMTTETRGQNSFVNFSGVNERVEALRDKARELRQQGAPESEVQKVVEEIYGLTDFADQKVGLLPEEFSKYDGQEETENNTELVSNYFDSPAKYTNQDGKTVNGLIKEEGQRIVFETENEIYDLGNKEDLKNSSLSDLNITLNDPVTINDKGNIIVRGKEYTNNFSDPKQAVNRDSDGNIISVNLETADGKKRTFKGQMAEDIAYQIYSKEFTKQVTENADLKQPDTFDKFINNVDGLIAVIDKQLKGSLGMNIAPLAAKGALLAIKKAAIATRNTGKAIQAGIEYLKSTDWYRGLSREERKQFLSKPKGELFTDLINAAKNPNESSAEKMVKTVTIDNKKETKTIIRENTGQTDTSKKVVVSEAKALRDLYQKLEKAAKEGADFKSKEIAGIKTDLANKIKDVVKVLGKNITPSEVKTIVNQMKNVNERNYDKVASIIDNLESRLQNRANKAKINRLSKLQKKANLKARTKYGNAGENIKKLTKLPANQIPEAQFDRYNSLMEKLAKGEAVDFNEVNQLYKDLENQINQFVERKNTESKPKKEENAEKRTSKIGEFVKAHQKIKNKVGSFKNLTDFERKSLRDFFNIPSSYLTGLETSKINQIKNALEHLDQTGYLPNKVITSVVMDYNSDLAADSIIKKVGNVLLKPAQSIINSIDGFRKKDFTSQDFYKKIHNEMLQHVDSVIKGIKGTTFYDKIVHPVTSNLDKSSNETNKVGLQVASLLGKAAKSVGSGFKTNVRLQFYFRQREFESNPEMRGSKVFSLEEHMNALQEYKDNVDFTLDDFDMIENEYKSFKGKSADEMFNQLTPAEKELVTFMDNQLKNQETANRDYNNHILGETLTYPVNYFPRKNSFTVSGLDAEGEFKARMDRLYGIGGGNSVKGDASNERTANKANPLNFNTVGNFMTNIQQSNVEKNLALPLKQTFMTISKLKQSENKSLIKVASAMELAIKKLLDAQMSRSPYVDSKREQIFNKFARNTFNRMLIDPVRLTYDIISNYGTVYPAFLDKIPAIRKATKVINDDVNKLLQENISSTQADRMGGSRSSDYKNAMSTSVSKLSNRKALLSPFEKLVDLYKHNKLSDFSDRASDFYYKYADLPAQHLWKFYLTEEFKNNTGKDFDGKKYLNDKNYREQIQDDLQDAASKADKKTSNFFNTGAAAEQKLKVQEGRDNFFIRINNFMRSFTSNENRVFWDSLKGLTGLGNTTFDKKSDAFRAFAVVNARGIAYSYLSQAIGDYVVRLVMGSDYEDDDENEDLIDKRMLKKSVGQHLGLIALGNSGAVANMMFNVVGELINKQIVEEEEDSYDPYKDNMFYAPNMKSKYTDFLNNLGPEGIATKSVIDMGVTSYNLVEAYNENEEITMEDIARFKAAKHTASLMSQTIGLPIDRIGNISQKVLSQKYPYEGGSKKKGGFGSFGRSNNSGFGKFK